MVLANFDKFRLTLMYLIQHCFICRPSDSTVSEDAGIEPRTVATFALAVRREKWELTYFTHTGMLKVSTLTSLLDLDGGMHVTEPSEGTGSVAN